MRTYKCFVSGLVAVIASVAVLSGCQYKDLEEEDQWSRRPALTLGFEWDEVDSIPSEMRVAFYSASSSGYSQGYTFFDVLNRDTTVRIAAGTYNVTAWNRDCYHVFTSGYSAREAVNATTLGYSTHGLYVMEQILDSIYNGQRVLDYPDYMVHANKLQVQVLQDLDGQKVILRPDSMVITIDVRLKSIKGLDKVKSIRGAINNIRGKRYMAFDNKTEDDVAVAFDAFPNAADSTVTARFWVFGITPEELRDHTMVTFFWLHGGRAFLPLDVTEKIEAYREGDSHIVIDYPGLDIDLNDYIQKGGGLVVDVDDWNDNFQNISF